MTKPTNRHERRKDKALKKRPADKEEAPVRELSHAEKRKLIHSLRVPRNRK